jgi:hypothetical protein
VKLGGTFYLPNDAPEKWRARVAKNLAYKLHVGYGAADPRRRGSIQREINALDKVGRDGRSLMYG